MAFKGRYGEAASAYQSKNKIIHRPTRGKKKPVL
jgi:hypothetical protein